MSKHAQLTVREIHGPYVQLLVNLQGEEGDMWLAALKRFLRKENPWQQGVLTVPAGLSFEERVARGRYDFRNRAITTEQLSVTTDQIGEFEWKLFHFNREIGSDEVIRLMRKEGYDPARIGHLLAFGEQYPEEQRGYPIFALGSIIESRLTLDVLALWDRQGQRAIELGWCGDGWSSSCHFLGVRRRLVVST